ncbi:MAG: caspase family protein [Geminicoccaceae bacterium]
MNLQPDPAEPGLWVNPAWQAGMPGSFAVVIGVSAYPHLDGGTEPAPDDGQEWIAETRTLRQLYVSALTARRFFDWLATDYRFAKAPIAKCWLLLSPTDAERAYEPTIADHIAEPTLANCATALKAWRKAIRMLPKPAQHDSRAFFFFSGHGLQVHHGKHLLLPSSYLGGDEPSFDEALGTSNLLYGMESLEIPDRFYFLDACRNDLPKLRAKRPEGQRILSEDEAALAFAGLRTGALLFATNSALQAWQPTDPNEGVSLFGQAVLEGLAGRPDIELLPQDDRLAVVLTKLHGFTRERVLELMRQHQSMALQSVMLDGPRGEECTVTELDPAAVAALRPPPPPPIRLPPGPGDDVWDAGGAMGPAGSAGMTPPVARSAATRGLDLRRMRADVLLHRKVPAPGQMRGVWARDFDLGHELFGSERVTDLWQNDTRVTTLTGRREVGADDIELLSVAYDDAARVYRLDVRIDVPDPLGYWVEAGGGMAGEERHGVVLPTDPSGPLTYRFAADIERIDGPNLYGRHLLRLDAWIAPSTAGPVGEAARLWRTYATADANAAVPEYEHGSLPGPGAQGQQIAPGRHHRRPGAAARRSPRPDQEMAGKARRAVRDLPDLAVLQAEQILRQEVAEGRDRYRQGHGIARQPQRARPPVTAEALSYAADLTERLDRARRRIPESLITPFDTLRERIAEASSPSARTASSAATPASARAGVHAPPGAARHPPAGSRPAAHNTDIDLEQRGRDRVQHRAFLPRQ